MNVATLKYVVHLEDKLISTVEDKNQGW